MAIISRNLSQQNRSFFYLLNSIKDINLYTWEYHRFYALKLIIINEYESDKIQTLLDEWKFRIIPFSNNFYSISLPGYEKYFISYNDEGIFVKANNKYISFFLLLSKKS